MRVLPTFFFQFLKIEITLVYKFHVYNTIFYCILYSMLTTEHYLVSICHHTVDSLYPFNPPAHYPFPSDNHYSVHCFYGFVFVLFAHSLCVFVCLVFIFHVNEILQNLSFSVWLISLSIISSRCIHVVADGKISSFYGIYIYVWTISSLSIHPLMGTQVASIS